MMSKICVQRLALSHFNISAASDPNAASSVSDHVVLHDLPAAAETHAVAAVFVDAVPAQLCPALLLHRNAAAAVVQNAVGAQPGQLTALQHGNAGTAVAVYEVGKHIQGLAALHVQPHCWRKAEGSLARRCGHQVKGYFSSAYLH